MIRCAITDGTIAAGVARRWAADGIDYIQLRNKSVEAGDLTKMARRILDEIKAAPAKLLINSRADVALATGAAGVHLTAHPDELTPDQVRQIFASTGRSAPVIGVSCHTVEEVERARKAKVDLVLFGPVFEKRVDGVAVAAGVGLEQLRLACCAASEMTMLALGGITSENAPGCLEAGAAGIAAIRLFTSY